MIETYKYVHTYYDEGASGTLLKLKTDSNTKTNGYKLEKISFNTTKYQHFFSNRVVNLWNSLPRDIVEAPSINTFKNRLDKCLAKYMYATKLSIYDIKINTN